MMTELMTFEEILAPMKGKKCRTCIHRQRWENYVGKAYSYCGKKRSIRTNNGHPRVKVTDAACGFYEEEK